MTTENTDKSFSLEGTLAFMLLRIWLGMRALIAGIEKFSGTGTKVLGTDEYGFEQTMEVKVYGFSHYHAMSDMHTEKFAEIAQPLLPGFLMAPYQFLLGPALIILGLMLFAGVLSRWTLFAMGLVYTSLSFGLLLINQPSGVAWLGIHVALVVAALMLVKHNRFCVTKSL